MACWFSFSLFLKISAVTYTTACARVRFYYWKASALRFSRWEVVRHARACSRCACLPARAGPPARDGSCSRTRRQRRKVGNVVWPIKSRQTNRQTDKHTLLFYRYRQAQATCSWKAANSRPRRSCSLLRSSLSSAVKVGRLVLRNSMGASKLDLWRIRFSTIRKVNTPREGKL